MGARARRARGAGRARAERVNIHWLEHARQDRQRQAAYIGKDSPRAAIEQIARILMGVAALAEHPERGRPGRRRGTRELVVSGTPFIVVYRVRKRPPLVEILRLLHGKQKWPPQ
jgi:toxin ParE1/3/4